MEENKRCYGCMNVLNEEHVCSYCSYDNNLLPENPLFIKPGTVINDYIFGRVLGHGGFGITYIGYDNKNERKVAIKEYLPSELATRHSGGVEITVYSGEKEQSFISGIEKFKKEAEMLKTFGDFPGIVDGYELFEANNTVYFVMEYIDGITLKEYAAQKGGRLSFDTVKAILIPVIDALGEMHRKGIIHRDISPDNIYITQEKQVKLLDFGAARHAIPDSDKGLSVILKHGFTPKEQYFTKGNQGPWTDVYALGATAYYLLTGTVPQPALDRLEQDKLVPLTSYTVGIDEKIDAVIRKALAIEEYNRYQSVNDFKLAMQNPELVSLPAQAANTSYAQNFVKQSNYNPNSEPTPVQKKKTGLIVALFAVPLTLLLIIGLSLIILLMPRVPDLSDMAEEEAIEELEDANFKYEIEYKISEKVEAGEVIEQEPDADKRTFKKYVEFTISKGPKYVEVPDVIGLNKDHAINLLEKNGFVCKTELVNGVVKEGKVVNVDPSIGETVDNGSNITIFISKGPDSSWVIFEDPNLEKAVISELDLDIDLAKERITYDMLKGVSELYLDEYSISSLSGIEAFTELEALSCMNNSLTEASNLPSTLTYLDLSGNRLTDLDLSNCNVLEELYLDDNNFKELPSMPKSLEILSLMDNQISDISDISSLNALWILDVSYNEIEDFTPLDAIFDNLTYLYVDGNIGTYDKADTKSYTSVDENWSDYITPTNEVTDVFSRDFEEDDDLYVNLTLSDVSFIESLEDIINYGSYELGDETFDLYSIEYDEVTYDFYVDPDKQTFVLGDIYGEDYPLFGEYDLWCQYDTYLTILSLFEEPTYIYYGDDLVFLDYVTPDIVYSFACDTEGVISFMRIYNVDYY